MWFRPPCVLLIVSFSRALPYPAGRNGWPGRPPAVRRLFRRSPRSRCRPARPSEDGGFDVMVEFCCFSAS
jgi:hypothetical protein